MIFGILIQQSSLAATLRIIGGKPVTEGEFPWMVALVYKGQTAANGQFCGGTLIHPMWVMTAGHCAEGETINTIEVVLNKTTLSAATEDRIGLAKIIKHPRYYNDERNTPTADIALLQLKQPVTQPIIHIVDHYSDYLTTEGNLAKVLGWGQTKESRNILADTLQQADVPLVSNDTCNAKQSYNGDIQEDMLCAGFAQGGIDACVGDSGGPLIVMTTAGWQQVGIVTFGEGCARPNFYGVYTRVASYNNFVAQTVCSLDDPLSAPQLQIKAEDYRVTASWSSVPTAQGYQLYYAPYSEPMSTVTLNNIRSIDMGQNTQLTTTLEGIQNFYVAIRAYRHNCYSDYSNIVVAKATPFLPWGNHEILP